MKFFWVVLLLASFFYNSVCFSYEGIIVPLGDKKINTSTGSSIDLKISLWPKETKFFKELKKLEGKVFLNLFHIVKVKKFEVSKNNFDVINVYAKGIAVKPYEKSPFEVWTLGKKNIPIEIRKIKINALNKLSNKFNYYSLDYERNNNNKNLIIILFFFIILGLFVVSFRFFLKNKKVRKYNRMDYEKV